ncbi:MAG TPA: efflux RND transporter periplasmic adaptor subunit, partial [Kofleriaceae bacterium]|nr:efflux RND transporter periplasmic adaptor subunit [Kofleriaceae bacterium]
LVKDGDVLATIESERYQIAVEQAKSTLDKAIATQKSAQAALDRRLTAQKDSPGLVPGEEIEQKQTLVDTAKADVEAARQQQHIAQLNLRDSSVRAPIGGVVQTRTVQQGQYLQPGAVLATILQRDPMLLRFQVTEQDAPRLKVGMTATLTLRESTREFTAHITLVGGAADQTTRLVPITAQVDQTDHQYWLRPGAFCQVIVPVGDARKGIVVPSLAVTPTEKGNIVYVVDDKNIAHARVVELGMHTAQGGVELTRGVKEGEVLVVTGIEPLSEGAPVQIKSKTTLEAATVTPDAGVPGVTPPPTTPLGGSDQGSSAATPPSGSGSGAGSGDAAGSGSGHRHKATP